MTLAYLSNYFPSLSETFIYREVFEMNRRGIHVRTYSIRRPDPSASSAESRSLHDTTYYLLPVALTHLTFCHLKWCVGHPWRYFVTLSRMLLAACHRTRKDRIRSFLHFGEGVVLAERMLKDGVTHIHAHFASQAASVARVIHMLSGLRYSFSAHAHDIWQDQLMLPQKLEEAEFAVVCSEVARKALTAEAKTDVSHKVHLVYHGLDIKSFPFSHNGQGREKNLILSVGRLVEPKGFPYLIEACALLKKRGLQFRCVIVGEGEQRSELEALIRKHDLSSSIELTGAVSQERIKDYYRRGWIFVLPCVDAGDGGKDGIPNVLMEAMATGIPVISTTNSGQPELIENGVHGILVPPRAVQELADSIENLCNNSALREAFVKEARTKMEEKFDNRKTIEPLIALFQTYVFHRATDVMPVPQTEYGRSSWKH